MYELTWVSVIIWGIIRGISIYSINKGEAYYFILYVHSKCVIENIIVKVGIQKGALRIGEKIWQ